MKERSYKEHELMDNVRLALSEHGCKVFRGNVGEVVTIDGRLFRTGLPKGFSDVFGVLPGGRAFFVETKVRPGKPTRQQLDFINVMRRQGALAGVAYSVEEALEICELQTK